MSQTVLFKRSSVKDKAPQSDVLDYGECAVNYEKDTHKLFIKDSENNIVGTNLGELDKELDAESTNMVENRAIYASIDELKTRLEELSSIYTIYGFARANGDASPKASIFFGSKSNLKPILDSLRIGLVKDGKLYKGCAKGRIDLATDGTELLIDGSDGDVLLYTDKVIYFLKSTTTVEINGGGVELNIIALGLTPFCMYGVNAKRFEPFAFTPQYGVKCQLTESNNEKGVSDIRECSHSIYNKNIKGSFGVSSKYNFFGNLFKETTSSYPSVYASKIENSLYAQYKNEDEKTNRPYFGLYYEFIEILFSLMHCELGTLDDGSYLGTGFSSTYGHDNILLANYKLDASDDTSGTTKFSNRESLNLDYTTSGVTLGFNSYSNNLTEMLEIQRLLSDVNKEGLVDKIWDGISKKDENYNIAFTYDTNEEDGKEHLIAISTEDMNFSYGCEGLENGKKYFKIQDVKGLEGMKEGVMTAIVTEYVRANFTKDLSWYGMQTYTAATETTPELGGIALFILKHPIYRGFSYLEKVERNLEGIMSVFYPISGGSSYAYNITIECAKDADAIPIYEVSDKSAKDYCYTSDATIFEKGLELKGKVEGQVDGSLTYYAKKANYSVSLFAPIDLYSGSTSYYESMNYRIGYRNTSILYKYLFCCNLSNNSNKEYNSAMNIKTSNSPINEVELLTYTFSVPHLKI